MGSWQDSLAQLSHTSSWQWWSDCRLMRSQNSVAPQYCKIKPAPTLLKTAREMKAVDRLPIPWSCTLMTDALWGTFTHNRLMSSVGRCICQWRWHSSIRQRLSDQLNAELVYKNSEMVGPGVCVHLYVLYVFLMVMMAERYGPVECACSQLKLPNIFVPGSTSSCGKKHWERIISMIKHKEWKTNAKTHTGVWRRII